MMNNSKLRTFYKADKCLQFLKNDLFLPKQVRNPKTGAVKTVYGPDEGATDNSIIRNNPKYQDLKRRGKSTKCVPHDRPGLPRQHHRSLTGGRQGQRLSHPPPSRGRRLGHVQGPESGYPWRTRPRPPRLNPAPRIVSGIGICYTNTNCRWNSIGTTIRNIHEF